MTVELQAPRFDALHTVGADVSQATSAVQALERAGLAHWNVTKVPVWADVRDYGSGDPRGVQVPSQYATVRTDPLSGKTQPLAIVGERYKVYQNEEHAEFLDALVDQSGGRYETAASFRNGALVYLSIKLPETVLVGGVDPVEMYLNGINSHDGSTQFMVSLDPVRAWCANQLSYFRSRAVKIRHTGTLTGKVQMVREALDLTFKSVEAFEREAEIMVAESLTQDRFEALVEQIWPPPKGHWRGKNGPTQEISVRTSNAYDRLREGLSGLFSASRTTANVRGTVWGGFNAVTEYVDWLRPVRGKTEEEKLANRAERIMTDKAQDELKMRARQVFAGEALAR